ncbi:sperm motility kinase 2A [Austrofundulus limnaeus]|uniref:Sperm motility kinase 2A n=1 Tax=Austrofundulus limnaeus TaxID=52670 RepID=A0A2I4CYP8_AUSLI|nr:PREDICTED: sperm motility kinase 2A-like [Austrofundulus limnaeus]
MAFSTATLAKGCFGKVYKEKYNDTWAAVKKVPQHLISRKDLERECEVYKKAEHPNIVKLLGKVTLSDGKWIIPLEFIFGEDLETTIFHTAKSKIQLTPSNKAKIIIGMCEGLLCLHCKDIVHQDLKPDNIMVEHDTNRAVIIDLGLAKFFRHGLNSAQDMGNEAYSAPEVLKIGTQRSPSSDVWAMGKIIAELCARVRLPTPSVCPTKIKETLKDQPYCKAVCRMVEPDPSLRASMAGVMTEIRRAGGAGVVANTPIQRELLKPVSPNITGRSRSPSPINTGAYLRERLKPISPDITGRNRSPSPINIGAHLPIRAQLAGNKDPSPFNGNKSPLLQHPRPEIKNLSPPHGVRAPAPANITEDKNQALVPKTDISSEFMKMKLHQQAAKDLPFNLPATGRVMVRRFEEKNGEMGRWEQTEVVTRDGKIVKYEDVKLDTK